MSHNLGKKLCRIFAFFSYVLSGCFIFSPLHKSENIIISLISAFLSGIIILISIFYFRKKIKVSSSSGTVHGIFSILSIALGCAASLMLITEIIKDTAYIASRGVSLFYYISISIAILIVSFYLCFNSEKGIYRFCILSAFIFVLFTLLIPTSFITAKSFIWDMGGLTEKGTVNSIFFGILSGVFSVCDASIFLYCFGDYLTDKNENTDAKSLILGYILAFSAICIYHLTAVFIFGSTLTKTLSDPDYALVKLIPGTDFTEIISVVRIFSFMIKSAVYLFCSANIFIKSKGIPFLRIIIIEYALIPASVIILCLFDRTLGYGQLQHLIYPCVIIFSLIFLPIQKNKEHR